MQIKPCLVLLARLACSSLAAADPAPLVCFGNEPSWSVDLSAPASARLALPDEEPVTFRGVETRNELLGERIWRGSPAAGRDLVMFLRDTACSDGMSDAEHPVTARVSLPDLRFLAGCCRVPTLPAPAAGTQALEGVAWRLVSLPGKAAEIVAALSRPATARFEAGQVSGFSGCNQFAGGYTVDADRLTFEPLAGTLMACPEPAMAVENALRSALSGTLRYAIADGRLKLTAATGAVLVFEPEPAPRLEGVGWEVTGFNNGRQAVVSPRAETRIRLSFADGTVSGNAGCNTFRAPYTVEGRRLEVGPVTTTRMACAEELMVQERESLAALESAVTWSVAGGVLDMHRADEERALMAKVEP